MSNLSDAIEALKELEIPIPTTPEPTVTQQTQNPATSIRGMSDNIQNNIRTYRKQQGLTQKELGRKCNLSQGTITRAERHMYISLWCLLRIAEGLGKRVDIV